MWRQRTVSAAATAIVMTGLAGCTGGAEPPRTARRVPVVAQRRMLRSVLTLGRSVPGRPIRAIVLGDPNAPRPVLVVGCIHGDETAEITVADRLAAGTRQNAHHVDLNRNFPFAWRPLGHPGDQQYAGPRALSEPESRLARTLILRLRPRLTIWFHQPQAVTDRSGGDARIEARFAARADCH